MGISDLVFHWILPLLLFLLAGVLIRLHLRQRAQRKESERIRKLQDKIRAALEEPTAAFDASLRQSLSRTRGTARPAGPEPVVRHGMEGEAPEKYRILSQMVARGMSAEEIASILGISINEAGQLVTLSSLSGR